MCKKILFMSLMIFSSYFGMANAVHVMSTPRPNLGASIGQTISDAYANQLAQQQALQRIQYEVQMQKELIKLKYELEMQKHRMRQRSI